MPSFSVRCFQPSQSSSASGVLDRDERVGRRRARRSTSVSSSAVHGLALEVVRRRSSKNSVAATSRPSAMSVPGVKPAFSIAVDEEVERPRGCWRRSGAKPPSSPRPVA